MNRAGFTHHFCMGDIMTGTDLPEEFQEEVLSCFEELTVQFDFDFTTGSPAIMYPNDKAQPAEEPEVEFVKSASVHAYEALHDLVKCLSIGTVLYNGDLLIKLKVAIEKDIEHYMETEGDTEAYRIASDWHQEKLCQQADAELDELKERRIWEE